MVNVKISTKWYENSPCVDDRRVRNSVDSLCFFPLLLLLFVFLALKSTLPLCVSWFLASILFCFDRTLAVNYEYFCFSLALDSLQLGLHRSAVILDYFCSNWRCQLEWPRSNGKFLFRGLLETCWLLLRLLMSCSGSLCGLSLFSCSLIDPSVYFWEHLHCANILPTTPPSFSVDPWGHDPSHGGSDSHQPLAAARNLGPRHTRKPPRITIFSLKYHPLTFSFLCIVGQKARDFASFFNQIQAALHQCTMG